MSHILKYRLRLRRRQRGLTLIELLVAALVTTIAISIAWTAVISIWDMSAVAEARTARQVELNQSLDFLTNELRLARAVNSHSGLIANGTTVTVEDVVRSTGLNLTQLGPYETIALYLERPTQSAAPAICPAGGPNAGAPPPFPSDYDAVVYDLRPSPQGWLGPRSLIRYGRIPDAGGTINPCSLPISSDTMADALALSGNSSPPVCNGTLTGGSGFYVCTENGKTSLELQSTLIQAATKKVASSVTSRLRPISPKELSSTSCANEGGLASVNGLNPTTVYFLNKTANPLRIYWLDYGGVRRNYFDLPAQSGYNQSTFVTHPWVVTDANTSACLGIYMPDRQPSAAIVQ